jgi:hypothetical protein
MKKYALARKYYTVFIIAFLLIFAGVSCLPSAATPAATPVVKVVEVNREVTRIVIREITRIVQVPVTVMPLPGPLGTDSPAPTHTLNTATLTTGGATPTGNLTPVPAAVTILIHTRCLYGPDSVYLGRYDIQADSPQQVIGRNQDSTWLEIKGSDHKYPCWVKASIAKLNSGNLGAQWVTDPVLSPYSSLYPPPAAVNANRVGNDVTIFWLPVEMAEDDYHGYLVEAWVCQGGKQVFVPQSLVTTFDDMAMKAVKFTDEPGCQAHSHARISSVNNQGYSTPKAFPWAAWPTPTP